MKKTFKALDDLWIDGRLVAAGSTGANEPFLMMTDRQAYAYLCLGQIEEVVEAAPKAPKAKADA